MLPHLEAVAQRRGEQPRACRGADQREGPQRHVDRAGVDAFAQGNVDAEVLHRRVEELFDGLGQAVDFVDEKDGSLFGVGEVGNQVLGSRERGAAGDLEGHAQVARDDGGESRLAESGRTVEKNVSQRLAALARSVDGDLDPLVDRALADHFGHPLRTQIAVVVGIGRSLLVEDGFAGHRREA